MVAVMLCNPKAGTQPRWIDDLQRNHLQTFDAY